MQSRIRWSSRKRVRVGIGVEERIQAGWPVNSPLSYPPSSTSQGYGEGHVLEHDKQITRFDCASINCCIGWIESIGISIGWVLFFEGLDNAIEDFPRSESTWKYYFFIFFWRIRVLFLSNLLVIRLDPSLVDYLIVILVELHGLMGFWIVELAKIMDFSKFGSFWVRK